MAGSNGRWAVSGEVGVIYWTRQHAVRGAAASCEHEAMFVIHGLRVIRRLKVLLTYSHATALYHWIVLASHRILAGPMIAVLLQRPADFGAAHRHHWM